MIRTVFSAAAAASVLLLAACSTPPTAQVVRFHTALCLAHADGRLHADCDLTEVHVRQLSDAEIERYVDAEQSYDCAGSFKSEGLGITLFERIDNHDPTALVGLPLIATCRLLRAAGFELVANLARTWRSRRTGAPATSRRATV